MNPLLSEISQMPLKLLSVTGTWRISGPRAVSSSRNESMSAADGRLGAPVPPLVARCWSLVIVGREAKRVMAL